MLKEENPKLTAYGECVGRKKIVGVCTDMMGGNSKVILKGHCIEFKYYVDGIHSGLTPPG